MRLKHLFQHLPRPFGGVDVAVARSARGLPDLLDLYIREFVGEDTGNVLAIDDPEEVARKTFRPGRESGVVTNEPCKDGSCLIGTEGGAVQTGLVGLQRRSGADRIGTPRYRKVQREKSRAPLSAARRARGLLTSLTV
ncbi:MAG: hypothetical protein M0P17_11565 [Methanoculleus sp.]|nr:hypothetical protein [Methanoculleus sp.]